jgi:hypothetical protein
VTRLRSASWLACVVLLWGACSPGQEGRAQLIDDDGVPFGLLDQEVPPLVPVSPSPAGETARLCFIEDGAVVGVEVSVGPPAELVDVVAALADPPSLEDRSLRTAVGDPPLVGDIDLAAGVALVDLLPAVTSLGGDEQLLAIAQIVCTLTGRPGVGPVTFTLEGSPVDVPRGDGSLTSGPVSRDDYTDLLD